MPSIDGVRAKRELGILSLPAAWSEAKPARVGEWVDFSFTRKSRQKLLGLLRQEKYRAKHATKTIDLEGGAHAVLAEYAEHHQLTFSAAVSKLLERVFALPSHESKRPR